MMHTPSRTSLFLAISALLACNGALAQEAQGAGQPQQKQEQQESAPTTTLDSVVVSSEYIPEPLMQSSAVISVVTREELARTGDADAAQALTRVSGLSLVGDKFVYVRGLGERYSSALFNGSPLPSPEPLQRVVPLDLFPSEALQSLTVQKTFTVRYPGEFGGGVIDLQGLTVPEENFLKLSVGIGGNDVTTFQNGLTYYGSDDDFWGYDAGARKFSPELSTAIASGQRVTSGENFTTEEIRTIGRSFNDPNLYLLQQKNSIDPDFEFGGSAGFSSEIDDGVKLGGIAVAGFSNEWRTRFGKQQTATFTGTSVEFDRDYDFVSTRNNARVNTLVGAGIKSERHQIGWTTLYVHDTLKTANSGAGFYFDFSTTPGDEARDDITRWIERKLVNNQLTGKHAFGEYSDLILEWRAASARADRNAPYETGIRYVNNNGYWAYSGAFSSNYFQFGKVVDDVKSAGFDITWTLPTERSLTLAGGLAWSDNDRNATLRRFRYDDVALGFYNQYQRVDYLLSDFNISQGLFEFQETTGSAGAAAYDGKLEVRAAYLQLEGTIVENLRASLGLRYEDATQSVSPYDIFTGALLPTPAPLQNDYLLPALTLTWNVADNQQIRLGASKTIARPQFRELAPQQYTDPDNERLYSGNPYLVDSELMNLDARYEWYFDKGEYFTTGVFYKKIDKPIEEVVSVVSGGNYLRNFLNAPEATLYGIEVDFKKYFNAPVQMSWWGENRLYLAANYTWTISSVNASACHEVFPADTLGVSRPATNYVLDGSRMQGQSDHIANLQFGIESVDASLQATLIANYVSERISGRGALGTISQPDTLEDPGTTLDFVLNKSFKLGDYSPSIKIAARNLLGTKYQEYQSANGNRVDIYTYEPGISYSMSVSLDF